MFRRHYNDLQDDIQSQLVLAGFLYSSNIIDADVKDIVQLPGNTVHRQNQVLLNAVEQVISSDPHVLPSVDGQPVVYSTSVNT